MELVWVLTKRIIDRSKIYYTLSSFKTQMAAFYARLLAFIICFSAVPACFAQTAIKIAKLKYNGGGDWYANKTALPNLIQFSNEALGMNIYPDENVVEAGSTDIFLYPSVYMTGHGNAVFSDA